MKLFQSVAIVVLFASVLAPSASAQHQFKGMMCSMTEVCEADVQNCVGANWEFHVIGDGGGYPHHIAWEHGYLSPEVVEREADAIKFVGSDADTNQGFMFLLSRVGKVSGVYVSKAEKIGDDRGLADVYRGYCEELE